MSAKRSWWFFIGLYGLALTDDTWTLEKMLFGDATIAPANTRAFLENSQADESSRIGIEAMMGTRPWREILDMTSIPFGNLIQQPAPNSFIVVRRNKNQKRLTEVTNSALSRAREIAAMLTIARSHGSLSIDGFMDVSGLDRSPTVGLIPYSRLDGATGQVVAQQRVYSARWLRTRPDTFSTQQLFSSLEQGSYLPTVNDKAWSIYGEEQFIATMKNYKRSSAQQRLVRAALHLYDAHHSSTPEQRLTQAVTSLEMLFSGTTNFSKLTQRLKSLLPLDSTSHDRIDLVMRLRHGYVHNGDRVDPPAGDLALGLASMTMYCFGEAVSSFTSVEALEDRLDLIASVQQSTSLIEEERQVLLGHIGNVAPKTKEQWLKLRSVNISE